MHDVAADQDLLVRRSVYQATIDTGRPPSARVLASSLDLAEEQVRHSLERLAAGRALVLQRDSREVLMANPFSAIPTPFAVHVAESLYYGNCIWDALGISAMLRADAVVQASCGCCGESMQLAVDDGKLTRAEGLVHFAVPAHRWWEDIVYN